MGRLWRSGALAASGLLVALSLAPLASGSPYVHAHRGGPLATADGEQKPRFPENTMAAFRDAASRGFVLELDAKLTADRVPVVIHDARLDRTTDCEGRVDGLTFAELRSRCEVDVLGTEEHIRKLGRRDERRARVPPLKQVLALAKRHRSSINVEVKNQQTDPDFDAGPGFARAVAETIRVSGFPTSRLIVQSFWPSNLDVFESDPYFDGAATSLLTLAALDDAGPAVAALRGYEWVSPAWPVSPAYIANAHALGLQVVPYTIDDGDEVEAATRSGVDAVISNDPRLARARVRAAPPILARDPEPGAPRVFAIQPKQELRRVASYTYVGKREFLAIAPWVTPADLPFPVDRERRACARARGG